jgi:hypothetical protein
VQLDAVEPASRALRVAWAKSATMPGISSMRSSRGTDTAGGQEEVACRRDRRWPDGRFAAAHVRVSDAATMPDLAVDSAARGVNRVGDLPPRLDLVGAVQARRANDPVRLVRDLNALSDDQSGGGALDVVIAHHVRGDIVFCGACAGHR